MPFAFLRQKVLRLNRRGGQIKVSSLADKAAWLRRECFEMVVRSKKGHFPSSSSCADILVVLMYGGRVRCNPADPHAPERDDQEIARSNLKMGARCPTLEDPDLQKISWLIRAIHTRTDHDSFNTNRHVSAVTRFSRGYSGHTTHRQELFRTDHHRSSG